MKEDTNMRDSISAKARLEATLEYSTRISKQSLSEIVPDTYQAIYDVLKDEYLQVSKCLLFKRNLKLACLTVQYDISLNIGAKLTQIMFWTSSEVQTPHWPLNTVATVSKPHSEI